MDRFIGARIFLRHFAQKYLKSNMDRFIDKYKVRNQFQNHNLKSNMDRFIGTYARAVKVFYRI